jgi:hypothetical protein
VRENPSIVQYLNIHSAPQIVFIDPPADIKYLDRTIEHKIFHYMGSLRLIEVLKFAVKKFGSEVGIIQNDDEMVD